MTSTSASKYYRLAIGVALTTLLFLFLAIGALGIVGDGGRPDRGYAVVFAVAVLGSAVARLRPRGMAWALVATAASQALVTGVVFLTGLHHGASAVDIVGINAMYVALFGLSAWLFRRAAEQGAPVAVREPA